MLDNVIKWQRLRTVDVRGTQFVAATKTIEIKLHKHRNCHTYLLCCRTEYAMLWFVRMVRTAIPNRVGSYFLVSRTRIGLPPLSLRNLDERKKPTKCKIIRLKESPVEGQEQPFGRKDSDLDEYRKCWFYHRIIFDRLVPSYRIYTTAAVEVMNQNFTCITTHLNRFVLKS